MLFGSQFHTKNDVLFHDIVNNVLRKKCLSVAIQSIVYLCQIY